MSSINNVMKCKWQVNAAFFYSSSFDSALLMEGWGAETKERAQQLKVLLY